MQRPISMVGVSQSRDLMTIIWWLRQRDRELRSFSPPNKLHKGWHIVEWKASQRESALQREAPPKEGQNSWTTDTCYFSGLPRPTVKACFQIKIKTNKSTKEVGLLLPNFSLGESKQWDKMHLFLIALEDTTHRFLGIWIVFWLFRVRCLLILWVFLEKLFGISRCLKNQTSLLKFLK